MGTVSKRLLGREEQYLVIMKLLLLSQGLQKSACSWPQPMTWLSFSSLSTIPSQLFQNVNQLTSLWRSKRQASSGLLNADQNDFIEFLEDFGEFKEGIATKM